MGLPEFTVGQVWTTPKGLAFTIESQEPSGRWRVSISDRDRGVVAASAEPWYFDTRQLTNLAQAKKFSLYNPKAVTKIDELADRLEAKGHQVLASALDEIGQDYAEAMLPKRIRQKRVKQATRQLETLKQEIKEARDPENIEKLSDQIKEEARILQTEGPKVPPANPISPPAAATKPLKLSDPKTVTKG